MQENVRVQRAVAADAPALARLGQRLWGTHSAAELEDEFRSIISDENAFAVLCIAEHCAVAFAHAQLRFDYVEGTKTCPVGFLEGIFVEEAYRNRGIARRLLQACEGWAREKGCTEFASDCELTNTESIAFHQHVGFFEANRTVWFHKSL